MGRSLSETRQERLMVSLAQAYYAAKLKRKCKIEAEGEQQFNLGIKKVDSWIENDFLFNALVLLELDYYQARLFHYSEDEKMSDKIEKEISILLALNDVLEKRFFSQEHLNRQEDIFETDLHLINEYKENIATNVKLQALEEISQGDFENTFVLDLTTEEIAEQVIEENEYYFYLQEEKNLNDTLLENFNIIRNKAKQVDEELTFKDIKNHLTTIEDLHNRDLQIKKEMHYLDKNIAYNEIIH